MFMFIDKRTIVFDFPLRYFSFIDFLDFACMKYEYHQIRVFLIHFQRFSFTLNLVLLEDFSCNKNCWSLSMLLRGGICFTSEKNVWAFLMTDKQFNTWYLHEHKFLQRNIYIERKLFLIFWSTYYVFPSVSVTNKIIKILIKAKKIHQITKKIFIV